MVEVLIIGTDDKRERYRFLYEPLKLVRNARVTVFRPKENIVAFFIQSILHATRNKETDFIIILGGNLKGLFWLILSRLVTSSHCTMRLGGDTLEIKERRILNASSGRCLDYFKLRLNHLFTRIIMNHIDSLIVVTDYLVLQVRKRLKRPIPIFVIPQPVLIQSDEVPKKVVRREAFQILTVTNLSLKEKYAGVQRLIRYLIAGCDEHDFPFKVVYNILGGGNYYDPLKDFLNEYMLLRDKLEITACGYVGETDKFYRNADLFMYCSTLDALPNVLLEAQIHGLPLLLNAYEPFFGFLEENRNALFFRENDAEDFDRKLLRLLGDETLRKTIGYNNIRNVKRRFTVDVVAKQWQVFLQSAGGEGIGSA